MTALVDVHVLYCHEPPEWIAGCLDSLHAEPVTVYLRRGIAGKVGVARANAFRAGNAPYVAFVDGDDEVMPGAFDAALEVLESRPEVVSTYCDIQLIGQPEGVGYIKAPWDPASQLQRMAEVHHLHVMRRSAVMPLLDELARWDGFEEYVLMGLLCRYGVHHHIPRQLYRFRQHNRYHRAGMIGGQAMRRAATAKVAPVLAPLIAAGVRQDDAG